MKSQRGAITVYVTISCLFVLIVGIASYVILTNKQMAQAEMVNEIESRYSSGVSLEETYQSYVGGEIIPITSLDNFKKIGTGEQVYIDGKVYTFGIDSTYVMQADLQCDASCAATITRIEQNDIVVTGLYTVTYNANGGTGTMDAIIATAPEIAASTFTSPGNARVFKEWNTLADGTGTSYAPGTKVSSDLTLYAIWNYTTQSVLSIGNEVAIKGEAFYVLENSNNTQETVTLLAKYNLDKNVDVTGKYYQKPNAAYKDTMCAFSSTNYWSAKWTAVDIGENNENIEARRLDLNNEAEYGAAEAGGALDRAKDYAENTLNLTRGTGRLLTYDEATNLQSSYTDMINGSANRQGEESSEYYLTYWLSAADENFPTTVYGLRGLERRNIYH